MTKIEEIYKILDETTIPKEGYNLKKLENVYWGKSRDNEVVFAIESLNKQTLPIVQTTKYLTLYVNEEFEINEGGQLRTANMSMLVLKIDDQYYLDLFVQLTQTFSLVVSEDELLKYFISLKDLFSLDKKASLSELQGFYGELIAMYILKINYGVDISIYYQTEQKRKFDFSITDRKKIEIKTTTKSERIHHFLQEQLNIQRFDVRIISIMLQKDDKGMSLKELICECKEIFASNLGLMLCIERMLKNTSIEEIDKVKFNYAYTKENIKIFDARNIPRLNEKSPDGVYNVEYDSDLSSAIKETVNKTINWINDN